jgi:Secretion system C-terminal sorting domain/NHL repeat
MKRTLFFFFLLIPMFSKAQMIKTFAGNGTSSYSGDGGPATVAGISYPNGIAIDGAGNVYFCDRFNARVRKINTAGIVTTIAGTGVAGFSGNGGPATAARLNQPGTVALDGAGNVYFSDIQNNCIRKIDPSGVITSIAGTPVPYGFGGDGGLATGALLYHPVGIAFDADGNLFIADEYNHRVRKINTSGIISSVAGNGLGGYSGDNIAATASSLYNPADVVMDIAGNVYVSDYYNHRIRKVNTAGIITTVAGNGSPGYSGDGGDATNAKLKNPVGIALDKYGNFYIGDGHNNCIRQVNSSGIISTVAGNTIAGYLGDGGPAILAEFNYVYNLRVDAAQNIYISDALNNRIRKTVTNIQFTGGSIQKLNVCQNSIAAPINTLLQVIDTSIGLTDTWSVITNATNGSLTATYTTVSTHVSLLPTGLTYIPATGYSGNDSFKIRVANDHGADTTTIYVTVVPLPVAGTITGPTVVCVGAIVSLSDAAPGGIWSAINPNATVTAGLVTGVTAGPDTIKYAVTNFCGTAIAAYPVTVNPLANAGMISGPSTVCIGSSVSLTDTIPGGTWSVTNANASVSSGIVTGVLVGGDTIKYTVTNSCGPAVATHRVSILPLPFAGLITGPDAVCPGAAIALADSVTGGSWSTTNANATIAGGVVTGVTVGRDTIVYTYTNSCGTATTTFPISINPLPYAGPIFGLAAVCHGGTITLTDSVAGGLWSMANGHAGVSGGIVTGIDAGMDTVEYAVTNSCGTAVAYFPVIVNPLPDAGTITGPATVCIGSTILLTDAVAGGSWNASHGNVTVADGLITGLAAGTDTINYLVVNTCGIDTATRIITILSFPVAGTISGPDTLCLAGTISLVEDISNGTWSSTTGAVNVSLTGLVVPVYPGPDTIRYTVTDPCGSATATFPLVVLTTEQCKEATGLTTAPIHPELKIYPNPNNGSFTVNLLSATIEQSEVLITNQLGARIMQFNIKTNTPVNVQFDDPPGIYFVRVNGSVVSRFVKY